MALANRRLQKEYLKLMRSDNPLVSVLPTNNILRWEIVIRGAADTLYRGEQFRLSFVFDSNYPIEAPEVMFLGVPPIHEHVYSSGHICLSILYEEWSPAFTVESICISIISMLASATQKKRPSDDSYFQSHFAHWSPKKISWGFHDDKC